MHLTFSPVRSDSAPLNLHRAGDALTVNGTTYDFGALPEGAVLPREAVTGDWLNSDVRRIGGRLHMTIILPHGPMAPPETLFPEPVIDPADGPVPLPPYGEKPPVVMEESHD